jgi:hypothetical protein|tara:strand:- start:191 stop:439 length:249 start_codon:yes stop_codon:yes gene_type:complete
MKKSNYFGKWITRFCARYGLSMNEVIDKFGRDSNRTIKLWFNGQGHPKATNYIMLVMTLSKLTGAKEEDIYIESSRAILRDG